MEKNAFNCICEEHIIIMTRRNHNGGTTKLMLHSFRQLYHIISLAYTYQLCNAITKKHNIKLLKSDKCSNNFQMQEQVVNFNGINTCSITN